MVTVWVVAGIVLYALGIASAVHAVMHGRTTQGTIAWVTAMMLAPWAAVPAYWVLGSSRFHGYVKARHVKKARFDTRHDLLMQALEPFVVPLRETPAAIRAAYRLADIPLLRGNRVDLLVDGEAMFESLLAGIDAAEHVILFQFYIVHDDRIGAEVARRLIARAKAGVSVHFLYDEIGSYGLRGSYLEALRDAGIHTAPFHTQKGRGNRFQLNFRNHRKVMVVDGRSAWIGGINIGDEYLGRDPKIGHWRDTHMRIDGPAALAVQLAFAEDWYWATDALLPDISWTPVPSNEDVPVLVVPTGPADDLETMQLMFHDAISQAKKRLWIATPYFVPDEAIVSALQLAALRGVNIRILIPERGDNRLMDWSAYSYVEELHRTGIRIFRYRDGFLHEKTMLVDDEAATVGSANFDNRSFRLNFEITGIVTDRRFIRRVEAMFEEDFARSAEMTLSDIEGRPFWFVLLTRIARLLSPVQ